MTGRTRLYERAELENYDRLWRNAEAKQATLDKIEAFCRRHAHSGVEPGAHRVAALVLKIIQGESVTDQGERRDG